MSRGKHSASKMKHRVPIIVGVVVLVLGLLTAGSAWAAYRYEQSHADRVLPGVKVAGIDVGGMTRDEATVAVTAATDQWLSQQLKVKAGGETWHLTPAELGVTADVGTSVDSAFSVADSYSWMDRALRRIRGESVDASFDVDYAFDKAQAEKFVKGAEGKVLRQPQDASVKIGDKGNVVFVHSKPGHELDSVVGIRNIRKALNEHQDSVSLPLKKVQPEVSNKTLGKTIVVDISSTTLTLYDGFKVERRYRVATAAPGYTTPLGTWKIINKVENPTWINPAPNGWGAGEPAQIAPGPGNPLGTRALYLDAPGIRIHGTSDSASIGTHASHGCIRMFISDSEALYPLVPVGTTVLIIA